MECTSLLENAEKLFLAGNLTDSDFTSHVQPCLPQACDQLYGSTDFDLAGVGFYYSTIIQVAVFVLCGPLQAFISRCLSPHASTSIHLSLARFQSVLDTAYSTGTLLAFGIVASSFVRTSLYDVAALERSIIRDLMDLHSMLQNLAMATYIIMKTAANITRGGAAWSFTGVYACCQLFNMATYFVKRRLDAIPSCKLIGKLCIEGSEGYPHLNTSEAGGWAPILVGILIGVLLVVLGILCSIALPKLTAFIVKIFSSRIVQASLAFVWVAAALLCVGYQTYHLTATRDGQEGLPAWDFGQLFVVIVWMPTLLKLFLAMLMTLTPESEGIKGNRVATVMSVIVKGLCKSMGYHSRMDLVLTNADTTWYGKEPCLVEDQPDEKRPDDDERTPRSTGPTQTVHSEEEKVPLVSESSSLDDEKMARNPSPGAQV